MMTAPKSIDQLGVPSIQEDIKEERHPWKSPFPKMATMSMEPALCAPDLTRDMNNMLDLGVAGRVVVKPT